MMNGIVDIKVNTYEQYKIGEWNGMQEELYRMSRKSLRLGQIQNTGYTVIGQIRNIFIVLDCGRSGQDNLTLGMMMAFPVS